MAAFCEKIFIPIPSQNHPILNGYALFHLCRKPFSESPVDNEPMASRTLKLICRQCSEPVMNYQKSGSGKLVRVYLDRVVEPAELARLKSAGHKNDLPSFKCRGCDASLGMPMTENGRLAYRLVPGAVGKRKD